MPDKRLDKTKERTAAAINAQPRGGSGDLHNSLAGSAHMLTDASAPFYTSDELLRYLSDDEISALRHEVLTTINNELVHPEDLGVTVPRLLKSCVAEAKELRRAMNSIASSQIVEAQRAEQIVRDSHKRVRDLRQLFLKQGELIQGMGVGTTGYAQLRQLHYLRDNVRSVIEWSTALQQVRYGDMYRRVEERHFREVYDFLKKLQSIRHTVVTQSGAQYRTFQAVFQPFFAKLDSVLSFFVESVYTLLTEDAMVIAIQRALEDDEPVDPRGGSSGGATAPVRESEDFVALKECIAVCGEELAKPVLNFDSSGVEQESPITVERVFAAIAKNVSKLWDEQIMIDVADPYAQISIYVDQMKKVEPLLEALELTLFPLSTTFPFFAVVVRAIHGEVMSIMEGYVGHSEHDIDANGLMQAAQFLQWYKEMVINFNYVQYVDISSIDELSGAFLTAAVGGLSAHLTRLCRACAINVCTDRNGPTLLPNGQPVTTGPVDMFTVLQQTLGGLTASVDLGVMRQIGKACADAIYSYLEECKQRSDYDYWEDENAALPAPEFPEEWQQRRMLLLYAFCNDCSVIEKNLDTIELKFSMSWDTETGEEVSPFQRVQDALSEHAYYYLDEITAQVERVVSEQWALVFRLGAWYDDAMNPTVLIVNTMAEYIDEEFAAMLPEQRMRKISRQMLIRYISKYLTTLMEMLAEAIRKPKKVYVEDWGSFLDCFARDTEVAMEMWRVHIVDTRTQVVDVAQSALNVAKDLLGVKKPVDFNFFVQETMLDKFGDCPTFVVRFCLEARAKELDKATRDRMQAMWKELIAYQKRDAKDMPTTGWNQIPSFFGSLDRRLAELEIAAGFFGKSVKKRVAEEQQRKVAATKAAKRAARKAKHDADSAATSMTRAPAIPALRTKKTAPNGGRAGGDSVEVASLADILK